MAWRPGAGSPNRGILFVSETVWRHWHSRRREISNGWVSAPPEPTEFDGEVEARMAASARLCEADLEALREEVRAMVKEGHSGPFIVPI